MLTDRTPAAESFALVLPELHPVMITDEETISSGLRSDRGRLAQLALRARAAEAEATRLEEEFLRLQSEDDASLARRAEIIEVGERITEIQARADAELLQARVAASVRVTEAIDEAIDLLSTASQSLDRLVHAIGEERASALESVVEPALAVERNAATESLRTADVEPVATNDLASDREPVFGRDTFAGPVLLSGPEMESFLDDLEARAVARGSRSGAGRPGRGESR